MKHINYRSCCDDDLVIYMVYVVTNYIERMPKGGFCLTVSMSSISKKGVSNENAWSMAKTRHGMHALLSLHNAGSPPILPYILKHVNFDASEI